MSLFRQRFILLMDRQVQLLLLSALVVIPLAFPRFLLIIPADFLPWESFAAESLFHTPLNLKEYLAAFLAVAALAAWFTRSIAAGRLKMVWTPLHPPLIMIFGLAVASVVLRQDALRLRLRDLSLVMLYAGFVHLMLLYGRERCFRRRLLGTFFFSSAVFMAITFAMDQGWYFGPFVVDPASVEDSVDRRRSLYSTIGHNISVASYLMLIGVYAAGRVMQSRRWWSRGLYAAAALLALYLIVAAQTVGVWLALVLLLPVALIEGLVYFRSRGFRLLRRPEIRWLTLGAMVLVIVFLGLFVLNEIISADRPGTSPLERLKERVDPRVLATGTRARLWMISLQIIEERFPLGLGLAGFKYHYADEQGKYFREHPDTILRPTEKHTDRVHNEYLQIWVELGVPGLLALLWGLIVFIRLQYRVLVSRCIIARRRLAATMAHLALCATLFHLLTSFELHVTTTALFFVMGFALWTGEAGFGRIKSFSLMNLSRTTPLAMILCILLMAASVGFCSLVGVQVIADSCFRVAELLAENQQVEKAAEFYSKSISLSPYRGLVSYNLGNVYLKIGEKKAAMGRTAEALGYFRAAEEAFTQSLETYRFKNIFQKRAKAWAMIAGLSSGVSAEMKNHLYQKAITDYEKTIEIFPSDLLAYYELGKLYQAIGKPEKAFETWRLAQEVDLNFMRDYHLVDAERWEQLGYLDMAKEYYKQAVVLNPKNPRFYRPLLDLLRRKGEYKEAVALLKPYVEDINPEHYEFRRMLVEFLALNGQRQQAKDLALSLLDEKPYTHSAAIEAERALAAVGMQEKSRRALERWLEENPEAFFWPRREFQVVWRLAGAYEAAGMPDREEELWKWFIGLPEDQTLRWVRGRAMSTLAHLYMKQGRVAPAAEMIRRRVALRLENTQYGQNASARLLSLFETPLIF